MVVKERSAPLNSEDGKEFGFASDRNRVAMLKLPERSK